jgi:ATP-dependent Clp protease ATP-binding subunit ClpA
MRLINAVRDMRTIRQLLTEAEAEARRGGQERPGPEHLLISAVSLPDRTAGRALARVGVSVDALRTAVQSAHAVAPGAVDSAEPTPSAASTALRAPTGALRSTPQAQQVFQQAVAASKATRPSLLTGAHVVAAASDLEGGTVARALEALGVDRAALRAAADAELAATR